MGANAQVVISIAIQGLVSVFSLACSAPTPGQPRDDHDFATIFAAEAATGTLVVRRHSDGREWVHHPARADSGFLPASTFKIVNAAIGLELGEVSGPDEGFPWDGVERPFVGWNRDHTLHTAMTASAVPVYQEVARRIGIDRMSGWLQALNYGNADPNGGLQWFWLTGDLRISARQQVDFLSRFLDGSVPFSGETREAVRAMILTDGGPGWTLHAKTGWAFEAQLGWWVGWVEVEEERYVFALNMDMPDSQADPPRRVRIGRQALEQLGALPGENGAP